MDPGALELLDVDDDHDVLAMPRDVLRSVGVDGADELAAFAARRPRQRGSCPPFGNQPRRALTYDYLDGHKEDEVAEERTVSLAEAKATLSELISAAESGEVIVITKRGKPVVELRAQSVPRRKVDLQLLQSATAQMAVQTESAGDLVRRMRDDARY